MQEEFEMEIKTKHGGTWSISHAPCHLGGPSNIQIIAIPGSVEYGGCVMIPEWNGWRLSITDTSIDIPLEVLKFLVEEAGRLTK